MNCPAKFCFSVPNTLFFRVPSANIICQQVARAVGRDPVEVQELNMAEGMQKA